MSSELAMWKSGFGDAYTERNPVDWRTRLEAFQQMLYTLPLVRVVEVGCNRGHNLSAISETTNIQLGVGVEPNEGAARLAKTSEPRARILRGAAQQLPFRDGSFDLAFTVGVLIHIPAVGLPRVLGELRRVTSSYVLVVEYFAEHETEVEYRGHHGLLWKRNFRAIIEVHCPDLDLIREGYWDRTHGFDRSHWWLFATPEGKRRVHDLNSAPELR